MICPSLNRICVSWAGTFFFCFCLRFSSIRFVRFNLQFLRSPVNKARVLMSEWTGEWRSAGIWRKDLKNHRMRRHTWTRAQMHFKTQEYKVYLQKHISRKMQWQQTPWISHHTLISTDLPKLLIKASLRTLVFYLIILIKWTPMSPLMRIKLRALVEFASHIICWWDSPEMQQIHLPVSNSEFKILYEKIW